MWQGNEVLFCTFDAYAVLVFKMGLLSEKASANLQLRVVSLKLTHDEDISTLGWVDWELQSFVLVFFEVLSIVTVFALLRDVIVLSSDIFQFPTFSALHCCRVCVYSSTDRAFSMPCSRF
jgi:hypothetical protein